MAGGLRRGKTLLRAQRPAILRLAGDLIFLDQVLGMPAGMHVGECVIEAVAQHAVVELAVAHAVAPTGAAMRYGAWSMLSMPPAAATVDIAEQNILRGRDDGLRPRATDPVDGQGRRGHRQSGMDARLTRRIHFSPACTTLPMTTVSTWSGRMPARATAPPIATAPRAGAGTSLRPPPKVPIAVRTGSAKTSCGLS